MPAYQKDEPPEAPSHFDVSDFGLRQVDLKWNPPENASQYIIERSEKSKGPFAVIFKGKLGSRYTDTGQKDNKPLKDASTYYYRVAAISRGGEQGPWSPVKESMTAPPPPPVTGLNAESGFVRCVPLTWKTAREESVIGYKIERAENPNGPFEQLEFVSGRDRVSEIDGGREPGKLDDTTEYYYRITAVNKAGAESEPSKAVKAVTRGLPSAVTGLRAESGRPREIAVSWEINPDEKTDGYIIERAVNNTDAFDEIQMIESRDIVDFLDRDGVRHREALGGLKDGTVYRYRITAYNIADAKSPRCEHVEATTKPAPVKPHTPDAVSGLLREVQLTWNVNPEPDIREYVVQYRKGSGNPGDDEDGSGFKNFERVEGEEAVKDELKDGRSYDFRIKAVDADGLESKWSDPVTATTKPPPDPPENLRAEISTDGGKVLWDRRRRQISSYIECIKRNLCSRRS